MWSHSRLRRYGDEQDLIAMMGGLRISQKAKEPIYQDLPNVVPYQAIQGHWVPWNYFYSKSKTFGYFKCQNCQKNWMSAHSFKRFKQGCKNCGSESHPTHLWQNVGRKNKEDKALKDNEKPHLTTLCEACQHGVCKKIRSI